MSSDITFDFDPSKDGGTVVSQGDIDGTGNKLLFVRYFVSGVELDVQGSMDGTQIGIGYGNEGQNAAVDQPDDQDAGHGNTETAITLSLSESQAFNLSSLTIGNDGDYNKASYLFTGSNGATYQTGEIANLDTEATLDFDNRFDGSTSVIVTRVGGSTLGDLLISNVVINNVQTGTPPTTVTAVLAVDTGSSAADGITSKDALAGTATAGSMLTISNGSTTLGSTIADADGSWSFAPAGLSDDTYTLTVAATGTGGSVATAQVSFTLDTTAPVVTAALADDTGNSASDGITSDDALAGMAEAGSTVTISNGSTVLGTTAAAADGSWNFAPTALADGAYTLTASETDTAGNTGSATVSFTMDTTPPDVTAGLLSAVDKDDLITGNAALIGSGDPEAVVTIVDGTTVLGTTIAAADGSWSFTPTSLADGTYTLNAFETDAANNTGEASVSFTLAAVVTAITAMPSVSGPLGIGRSVVFTLTTSQAVTVDGSPVLTLNNGALASYNATQSTATSLVFNYEVSAEQATSDLTVTGLVVDGGTIFGNSELSFAAAVSYDAGANPYSVTTADLNEDGKADLVVADEEGGVSVLLGNGSGGFATATSYAAGSDPRSVTAVDLNGDGKLDLAVADSGGGVSVLPGDGSGGFGTATSYDAGDTPKSVITADLNGNGKLDLVVADSFGGVSVLLGNGNGGFGTATSYAAGTNPASVIAADLNGDGRLDLVVADLGGGVSVLLGNSSGGFGIATNYAAGTSPASVTEADLNGDGKLDLVVADQSGGVSVLLGDGSGGFATPTSYDAGAYPNSVTTADVNGDSKLDLVVADVDGGVSVLLGDGDGGFGTATSYDAGDTPISVTTADLNGDGKPDLVVADADGGVSVLLNHPVVEGLFDNSSVTTASGSNTGLVIETTPVVTAALVEDTGSSTSDGITSEDALAGTAAAGDTVTISNGSVVLGSVKADTDGSWSFVPTGLADGSYTLTISDTDTAGDTGSAALSFTLDTTAPLVTAALADDTGSSDSDSITTDATLTGTGDRNAIVTISDGVTVLGTTTADIDGNWSFAPTSLGDGSYTLTASETDISGNPDSAAVSFTLDTAAPVVSAALVLPNDGGIGGGSTGDDALTGTADAGSIVTISNGATVLGTVTADARGDWSFIPAGLADGRYILSASESDTAGNTGTSSVSFALVAVVDSIMTKPSAPGPLGTGRNVTFTLATSQNVYVTGTPTLILSNGASATFDSTASTVNRLVFGYTVAAGQDAADLKVNGLSLNSATIAVPNTLLFDNSVSYAAGQNLDGLAVADLNGDGKPDLVAADYDGGIDVLLNNGLGGFEAAGTYASDLGARAVTVADVNGDGSTDLIVTSQTSVDVLLNNGSGGFSTPISYIDNAYPQSVAVADVDGDGKPDLIVADLFGGVDVLLNNGSDGFEGATSYAAGEYPQSIAVADINGDAKPDLIIGNENDIDILLNNGSGGFDAATSYGAGEGAGSIAVGDLNGDGKPDIVVTDAGSNTVDVLLNNGSGGFDTPISYAVGSDPVSVTVADVNGDGKLDLTVADREDNAVDVLLNNGAGGFQSARPYTAGDQPNSTAVADVDGDGKPDVIVADRSGDLTVLQARSQDPAPALATSVTTASGTDTGLVINTIPPTVTAALAADTGSSAMDGITAKDSLTGSGDPDALVTITNNGAVLGTTTAGSDGSWSFTPPGLADDAYTLIVSETNTAGNTGSAAVSFTLDTTAPVVTVALADDTGNSASDGITSDDTLAGMAEAGGTVTISNGSTVLGTTAAAADGSWNFAPTALADGAYTLTASETDTAGNTHEVVVPLTLDTAPPEVTARLASVAVKGDYPVTGNATLIGDGDSNALVTIREGETVLGTTTAAADGTWSFTSKGLVDGTHTLTAGETDAAGNTGDATVRFTLASVVAAITAAPSVPGPLGIGQSVAITLGTSQAVMVTGSPILHLSNGATASYDTTRSTSTSLVFDYTVAAGQNSTDLTVLGLNGGNIVVPSTLSFASAVAYEAASRPSSMVVGDVNGDGTPDLVVGDQTGKVVVLLGNGSGGFGSAVSYAAGSNIQSVAVADVNGDGKPDIIAADFDGGTDVLLNNGSGGFGAATSFAAGSYPGFVTTGDMNDDGKTDLVVVSQSGVNVLLGDGSGGFGPAVQYNATMLSSGAVGDVNEDGKPDLVVVQQEEYGNVLEVLSGDGLGGFSNASTLTAGQDPVSVAIADLNGDGKPDLVVTDLSGYVDVLLGEGSGVFSPPTSYAAGSYPLSSAVADVNGDGKPDLIVADGGGGTSVLLNNGSGGFDAATSYTAGNNSFAVAAADLNEDEKPDLVVLDGQGNVSVLLNTLQAAGTFAAASVATASGADTELVVDTTPPSVTAALATDTGSSITDAITSDDTLRGAAEAGGTVTVSNGTNVLGTTTAGTDGNWSFAPTRLADGAYTLTASDTDTAGNTGSASLSFTLDTTSPAVTAALATDTGNSATDGVTRNDTLTGTAEAGGTVTVSNGTNVLGTTTAASSGSWNFAPTGLADGTHTLTASETDVAGNTGSATMNFILDTTPPTIKAALAADTGRSATDGITRDDTLTGSAEVGDTVTISNGSTTLGTTVAASDGSWSFAPTGLADGTHTLTASETDVAGNTGSATVGFTLDTTLPAVTAALAADTGSSTTDGITSNDTLTGTAEAGGTVTISNGTSVLGTTTAGTDGSWSFVPTGLAEGAHTLTASETDAAGNTGSDAVSLTLDTTAPIVTATLTDDTGSSAKDGITRNDTLTGTAAAGDTVTILNGSVALGTTTADSTTGAWSYAPAGLTDGSHTLTASDTDAAGNTGSAKVGFTLDTTAPIVTVALADDTGRSAKDGLTSNPAMSGTGEADTTIVLSENGIVVGSTLASAAGSWTIIPTSLADGSHSLVASQTDAAGNIGIASVSLILDTVVPVVTAALSDDTGTSSTDGITYDPALAGTAAANATVVLSENGTALGNTTTDGTGHWVFTPSGLQSGTHVIVATDTDAAGNTGSATASFTLATAPSFSLTAALLDDTGSSATDSVTSNPTLSGTGAVDAVITIASDGRMLGTARAGDTGAWSYKPTGLADGLNTLTVSETDTAGQTETRSISFVFDTAAPVVTAVLAHSTGSSVSDNIASDDTLSGTADPNATITLTSDGKSLGAATASSTGAWRLTPTSLADGSHTIVASETDAAGNTGSASVSFILDTTAPIVTAALADDTGSSVRDSITSDAALTGTAEADSTVKVSNGSTVLGTTTAIDDGSWSFVPAGLADGAYTLTASETDAAGNTGTATLGFTLDTTTPTVSMALAVDTGSSASDGVTSDDALTGRADAGSVVTISRGEIVLGTTTADGSGAWSFIPKLADGAYTLTASETDTAGNTGTALVSLILDTAVPAVTAALSDDTGASSTDGITYDPALSGTAAANATVVLSENGTALGSTATDGTGHWVFTPSGLANGVQAITATTTNAAGNSGSVTVDFTLETAPSLALTAALLDDTGSSATDGVTSNPTLSGTGAADALVTIARDGRTLVIMQAGGTGAWSYTPTGLADGPVTLSVSQTDTAGLIATRQISFVLDTTAPVVTAELADDTGSSASDNITSNGALSGTVDSNAVLVLTADGESLGTISASSTGAWSFIPTNLADGAHTVVVSDTDAAGNTGSASVSFTLDTKTSEVPTLEEVATSTATARPELTGTADADSTLSLFDGATLLETTTATASGSYNFTVPVALAVGTHTLTTSASNVAGNISAGSIPLAVTIDDDNSYTVTAASTATGTIVTRAYNTSGQYSSVDTTDKAGLLLQSVTPTTTVRNIYDTAGTLIGTVSEAGSATGSAAPDFTTKRLVQGAATTTDNTGSHVTLLAENHDLTLQGDDIVTIDGGNDTISASSGSASASGGSGSLLFNAGSGTNTVSGGTGTLTVVGGSGSGLYTGGSGAGNVLSAGSGNTTLLGGSGGDQLRGGTGNTTIVGSTGGSDTITGGAGINQITATRDETVFGGTGQATVFAHAGGDNLVVGTGGTDQMDAEGNGNALFGGSGAETMFGGTGTSTMVGGVGTALMVADTGNTEFVGGSGQSTVWGGTGTDVIWTGTGQMQAVESMTGDDTAILGSGSSTIYGGLGADVYDIINGAGGGSHTISGFKVGTDIINPIGYNSSYTQQSVGGSTVLSLADGTTITLLNVSHLNSGSSA